MFDALRTAHGKPVHLSIEPNHHAAQSAMRSAATEADERGDLVSVSLVRNRVELTDRVVEYASAYDIGRRVRGRRLASWSVSDRAQLTGSDIHSLTVATLGSRCA